MGDVADVQTADTDFWVMRLGINMLGYATIFVPGYLMIRYLRRIQYDKKSGKDIFFMIKLISTPFHCVLLQN